MFILYTRHIVTVTNNYKGTCWSTILWGGTVGRTSRDLYRQRLLFHNRTKFNRYQLNNHK